MQKHTTLGIYSTPFGEAALASRKVWLAGLGATVVTREWVESEGRHVFRTLVRQGSVVESRAIRFLGDRIETSFAHAETLWRKTRRTAEATVKQAVASVVDYAQQVLPKSLPALEFTRAFPPATKRMAPAKRARKTTKSRVARVAKRAKRA